MNGKMHKQGLGIGAALVVALAATGAGATVLMSENFDTGYTEGTQLPVTAAPGWTAVSVNSGGETTNLITTTSVAQSSIGTGTLGLRHFDGGNLSTAPNARYTFGTPVTIGPSATENVLWSFDFNMANAAIPSNVIVRLDAGTGATAGPGVVLDRNDDGDIYFRTNAGTVASPGAAANTALIFNDLASDAWYRLTFTIDTVGRTYSIQLRDAALNPVASVVGAPTTFIFEQPATTSLTGLLITDNNASGGFPDGGDTYFDNLSVTTVPIPEPAGASAGVVIAMGALAHRRRRRAQ